MIGLGELVIIPTWKKVKTQRVSLVLYINFRPVTSWKLLVCKSSWKTVRQLGHGAESRKNGMVPNAYLMNDSTRIGQVQQFLDYVIDHQQGDGWIGPETGSKPRYLWGR